MVSSSSPPQASRQESNENAVGTGLNHFVFWPPFLLLLSAIVLNFWSPDQIQDGELVPGKFSTTVTIANTWVLDQFGWLFSVCAFFFGHALPGNLLHGVLEVRVRERSNRWA